jgi:hypothetical protein
MQVGTTAGRRSACKTAVTTPRQHHASAKVAWRSPFQRFVRNETQQVVPDAVPSKVVIHAAHHERDHEP